MLRFTQILKDHIYNQFGITVTNNQAETFFISYASSEIDFAREVEGILKSGGYATIRQEDHFGTQNFMEAISEALESGARVIALFSQSYFKSDYCRAEVYAAIAGDPLNTQQRLIPFRIDDCLPPGLLSGIAYVDLVQLQPTGETLRDIVLGVVKPDAKQLTWDGHGLWKTSRTILHPEIEPVANFSARKDELKKLKNILFSGQTAVVTATISAMGGVGKTVLAQQYGWECREDYAGVWWLPGENREAIVAGLVQLGAKLVPNIDSVEDRSEAAQLTLQAISESGLTKPWLLIYDNIEDPSALKGLTPKNGVHVLVTSRWQDWGVHAQVLDLEVFSNEEAVQFLLDRTERMDKDGAKQLAELLGNLPLALEQAAAYCRYGVTFRDYIEVYREMLKQQPGPNSLYPHNVWTTFSLAMKQVRDGNRSKSQPACPEADKLLNIAAYLAPDDIPLEIFPDAYLSIAERGNIVKALADVSLIKVSTLSDGAPAFSLHRLVQEVVRDELRRTGEVNNSKKLAVTYVNNSFPSQSYDVRYWPEAQKLETHTRVILKTTASQNESWNEVASLNFGYAGYLHARANYTEAEPLYRRAIEIFEDNLGPDHHKLVYPRNDLAILLDMTNRRNEAEPLFRHNLKVLEDALGPNHPDIAALLNGLGILLSQTSREDEAEPLFYRAIEITEQALNPEHPDMARPLANLAHLLENTNRQDEAEPLYRRALMITEKAQGPYHPEVSNVLNNLAALLKDTNREKEAEPLYRRSLKIREDSLGSDHPDTIQARDNLNLFLANKAENQSPE